MYKKVNSYLKQFPKQERYSLGQKIQAEILELITGIFLANQLPNPLKEDSLLSLNARNETLKLLFRLAYDINALELKKYLAAESDCQEIGKMLGGWIKFLKSQR